MQARHVCSANNLKVLFVLLVTAALSLTPIDASASKATAILELMEKLTGKSLRNLSDESGAGGRQAGLHEASRQAADDEARRRGVRQAHARRNLVAERALEARDRP